MFYEPKSENNNKLGILNYLKYRKSKSNHCFVIIIYTYTLFDGLTDYTRGYFTSCVVFFQIP